MIEVSRDKNICSVLNKFVSISRTRVNFELQILALLLVFHQTLNLSCSKFAEVARQVEGFVSCISPPLLGKITAQKDEASRSQSCRIITTIAVEYKTAREGLDQRPTPFILVIVMATVTTISREWHPYDLNDWLDFFFQ